MDLVSLIFICLLPLTASGTVTPGQNHIFTNVVTGPEMSSYDQLSQVSGRYTTPSIIAGVNPTKGTTIKPNTEPSLQATSSTEPSKIFLPNSQASATSTSSSSQLNSSTEGIKSTTERQFQVSTSATKAATSPASNPTEVPLTRRSSTQSQDTQRTQTSQFTTDKLTRPASHPTQPTTLILSTSTKSDEPKSASTSPAPGGDVKRSTTKKPSIPPTNTKKRQDHPDKKEKSKNGATNSKVVAGLIGGALVLMMLGFLFIYVKKRKLQRQQITTSDWAGPSPFLEGGADNGQVTLRSSNRISLSSFLPHRLSKRLSLLAETDEELQDITPGTTFGDKHQEGVSGRELDGNDGQESNGTAVVVPEKKSIEDAPETVENSVSSPSPQTNDPTSNNTNLEVGKPSEVYPEGSPTGSGVLENAQLNGSPGQP